MSIAATNARDLKKDERRAFVRKENEKLGRFLNVEHLRSWSREYRCACGFKCYAPGEIFDHAGECKQ